MAEITVARADDGGFHVVVREGRSSTEHDVTISDAEHDRLATRFASNEAFLRACFEFLLEREPKESILSTFDVSVIGRYFAEFEREIVRLTD